jgi:hypothetical protein
MVTYKELIDIEQIYPILSVNDRWRELQKQNETYHSQNLQRRPKTQKTKAILIESYRFETNAF